MGSFGATWGARYYSSQKETCLSASLFPDECTDPAFVAANAAQTRAINKMGSVTFNDVQFSWNAPWNWLTWTPYAPGPAGTRAAPVPNTCWNWPKP